MINPLDPLNSWRDAKDFPEELQRLAARNEFVNEIEELDSANSEPASVVCPFPDGFFDGIFGGEYAPDDEDKKG